MIKGKAILLDSCVIQYSLSKEKGLLKATVDLIEELIQNDNKLYVSEFSYYELLRSASTENKAKVLEELDHYEKIPQSADRLERATLLYSAYLKEGSIKSVLNSISDMDVFIGSLVFTDSAPLLLTADFNDYPRPFFKETEVKSLEYKKGRGHKCTQYYYFLEANLELFR